MYAYLNGHILGLINNFLKADVKNLKNISRKKNVSIAQESQIGITHFGLSTFADAPLAIGSTPDIFVITLDFDAGAVYQFLLWDGYGGNIFFRGCWGNRSSLEKIKWKQIAFN